MQYFGTVRSFDHALGTGKLTPETGGNDLDFDRSALAWGKNVLPAAGLRLSYDVGTDSKRQTCAFNLQAV